MEEAAAMKKEEEKNKEAMDERMEERTSLSLYENDSRSYSHLKSTHIIYFNFVDLALDLLQMYCEDLLLTEDDNQITAVIAISMMPSGFRSSFITQDRHGFGVLAFEIQNTIYKYWQAIPGLTAVYNMKMKYDSARRLLKNIRMLYSLYENLEQVKDALIRVMFNATEFGIVEFIEEIIHHFPQLLRGTYLRPTEAAQMESHDQVLQYEVEATLAQKGESQGDHDHHLQYEGKATLTGKVKKQQQESITSRDDQLRLQHEHGGQTIFHYAICQRQEQIFGLLRDLGPLKEFLVGLADDSQNYMSHLAAKKPHDSSLNQMPRVALQVQHEIQWYKEVESIMQPATRTMKNKEGHTSRKLFTVEHKKLVKEGAKWMKETAQ
ncbi:uncharacterized protein LOC122092377 [Macadamia integrifolia]|uniref:uncharacterized protein LOC122092377 n=1 Tax=Macadamia integrifolia TaxID=60698 RepID=UPI001C52EFBB|nr:uncharacterized protein LOC122092377 [Macadamia integrifolia]